MCVGISRVAHSTWHWQGLVTGETSGTHVGILGRAGPPASKGERPITEAMFRSGLNYNSQSTLDTWTDIQTKCNY